MAIRRALSIGFESSYGASAAPKYYFDPNRVSLDSPSNPFLIYSGASGRGQRTIVPTSYVPQGDIETVVDTWRAGAFFRAAVPELNYQQLSVNKSSTDTELDVDHAAGSTTLSVDTEAGFAENDLVQVGGDFGGSEIHKVTAVGTGELTIADGLTRSHAEDATVTKLDASPGVLHIMDFGGDITDLDSMTVRVGKDFDTHAFYGCAVSQITLSIAYNTMADLTASIIAQKDASEDVFNPPGSAFDSVPFAGLHVSSARLIDTASPGTDDKDIINYIRSASFTFNNNVQAEDGMRMGSRFPVKLEAQGLELTASLTLEFKTRDQYKDFWGADSPGTSNPKPRNIEIKLSQGTDLFEVYTFNSYLTTPVFEVSGRDMLVQTLEYQTIQRDPVGARGVMGAIRIQNSEEFRYS